VLDRFGDATLVANAFATTATGGTAMPTRLTRTAGTFAMVASIAWLAVAPAALIGAGADDWEVHYFTLALTAFVASACTTVALFGLLRRAGSVGVVAAVAVTLAVLGTLLLGIVTWAWLLGVGFLTIASALSVREMRRARLGTALENVLLVAAWPIAVSVAIALEELRIGPIDSYGDAYLGQLFGLATGGILYAAGLFVSGRWLRRETAVDESDVMATA
jgi:polyferredoxin